MNKNTKDLEYVYHIKNTLTSEELTISKFNFDRYFSKTQQENAAKGKIVQLNSWIGWIEEI